jgi:RND superfamily putative drug exporter
MQLIGEWNWWLPGWLDRRLPDMDFESSEAPEPGAASPVQSPA